MRFGSLWCVALYSYIVLINKNNTMYMYFKHVSLLCIKLQELNTDWEQFGSTLHVKFDTLQQIKSNPERLSVRSKMTSVLLMNGESKRCEDVACNL